MCVEVVADIDVNPVVFVVEVAIKVSAIVFSVDVDVIGDVCDVDVDVVDVNAFVSRVILVVPILIFLLLYKNEFKLLPVQVRVEWVTRYEM